MSALETDAIEVMQLCAELGLKVGVVTFQVRKETVLDEFDDRGSPYVVITIEFLG